MVVVDSVTKRPHFIPTNTTVSSEGGSAAVLPACLEAARTPARVASRPGVHIHLGIHEGAQSPSRDQDLGLHRLPSAVRRSDRAGQPGTRDVPPDVLQPQPERLGRTPSFSGIRVRKTTSIPQPKSLPSSRIRAGTLGWASNRMWMLRTRMQRLSGIGCRKELEEAKAALVKAQDEYARYYNRRHDPAPVFEPGDMVLLDASDIRTNRVSKKLDCIRLGPFEVEAAIGNGAYRLKLPESMRRLHPVFPVVKTLPPPAGSLPWSSTTRRTRSDHHRW